MTSAEEQIDGALMLGMITGSEEVEKRGESILAVPLGGAAL